MAPAIDRRVAPGACLLCVGVALLGCGIAPVQADPPPEVSVTSFVTMVPLPDSGGERQCLSIALPHTPPSAPSGYPVTCLLLVTLPAKPGETCKRPSCDADAGLSVPSPEVLDFFCDTNERAFRNAGGSSGGAGDPALESVCVLTQLSTLDVRSSIELDANGSCTGSPIAGWCYVDGAGSEGCRQILFAQGSPPHGSFATLICLSRLYAQL